MTHPAAAPDISLDELRRLIRILGLLGSAHDGEALNAARLACRWVADKGSSWEALLTPLPEPLPVVAVAAPADPDVLAEAYEADRAQAFRNGYAAGMRDMAQQLKAQAAQVAHGGHAGGGMASGRIGNAGAQGRAYSGFTVAPGSAQGGGAQTPAAAPAGAGNAMSWQQVAQQLLDRHAAGIPGVLRSREEQFVQDILARGFHTLTQPQEDWLRAIAGRSAMSW